VLLRDTPTATKQWHTLKVQITGKKVEGYLDDKLLLEHELPDTISGRVGVWSKADSVVYMDDYVVAPK